LRQRDAAEDISAIFKAIALKFKDLIRLTTRS